MSLSFRTTIRITKHLYLRPEGQSIILGQDQSLHLWQHSDSHLCYTTITLIHVPYAAGVPSAHSLAQNVWHKI